MKNSNSISSNQKKGKKTWRNLSITIGVIAVVSFVSHIIWKNSGTGEWEFYSNDEGVQVFTLKSPDTTVIQVKGIIELDSKLAGIMKLMRDPESCDDVGCYESKVIKTVDYPRVVFYTFRYDMFFPLLPREYVVESEFFQDPDTKEIQVDYKAAVDALPLNDCCQRVSHMHNRWRFTPKANGKVEAEFLLNSSPGGAFPYFLYNLGASAMMQESMLELQGILDREKFKTAVVDYVMEVNEDNTQAIEEIASDTAEGSNQ